MNIFKGKELYLRTIIYILAVIVFFGLWRILGPGTAFIGATIAKGSLVLMNTDLTGNKIRSTISFLILFVFIGLFSFIASLNIYIGLIINFLAIFLITYNFVSNLKQWIWRPFVLGYLYLLIEPGTLKQLPIRILVLALGALFLMLTQLILNKNKSNKKLDENIKSLLDKISSKIDCILDGDKNILNENLKVDENVSEIINVIYSKRIEPLFITKKDNMIINVTLYIERLNYLLKEININLHNDIELEFMKDLKQLINDMKKALKEENLVEVIEEFINKNKDKAHDDYYLYEILQNLSMLQASLKQEDYSKKDIMLNRKLRKEITSIFNFRISRKSLRFSFAFRSAILLSVSYFIAKVFAIEEGKWIMFTIYAVIEPFFEESKKRFPKRFKGTVLGIILFGIIYLCIKNIYIEGFIFVIIYYIYVISKDFKIKTTCTAAVSLGLFAIVTKNPESGIVLRFSFVVLGIIIGYLGTKFIFPYDIKKSLKMLVINYTKLSKEILDFSIGAAKDKYYYKVLGEKVMLSKLYESKIIGSNNIINDKDVKSFVYNQRILNNTIYFNIFFLKTNGIQEDILTKVNYDIKEKDEKEILVKIKNEFQNKFHEINSNEEKLVFLNMQRIVVRLKISENLTKKIENREW